MKIRTLSRLTHDYQVCEVEITHENGDPNKIQELQDKCTAQAIVGLQRILGQIKALKESTTNKKKEPSIAEPTELEI